MFYCKPILLEAKLKLAIIAQNQARFNN